MMAAIWVWPRERSDKRTGPVWTRLGERVEESQQRKVRESGRRAQKLDPPPVRERKDMLGATGKDEGLEVKRRVHRMLRGDEGLVAARIPQTVLVAGVMESVEEEPRERAVRGRRRRKAVKVTASARRSVIGIGEAWRRERKKRERV